MTDQLKDRFDVLTDDRPEPADPAIQVRQSIGRRRRRRSGLAVIACAAATAAAVIAVPALGSLRSTTDQPGVAGFAPSPSNPIPQATKTTEGPSLTPATTDHHRVLPEPWSDEVFTRLPDANAYAPYKAYYVAKGKIPTENWAMLVYSTQNCLVGDEGPAGNFGDPHYCFDRGSGGKSGGEYVVLQGHTKEKSTSKIDATMVLGTAPIGARAVRVKAGGKTYTAPAVATPSTDTMRFFTLVIPGRDLEVTATAVNQAGKSIGALTPGS
jgi:hypothetical protein